MKNEKYLLDRITYHKLDAKTKDQVEQALGLLLIKGYYAAAIDIKNDKATATIKQS